MDDYDFANSWGEGVANTQIEKLEKEIKKLKNELTKFRNTLLTSDTAMVRGVACDFLYFLQTARPEVPSKEVPEESDKFIQEFFDFMASVLGANNEG